MVVFLGLYLGITFLISSGAILAIIHSIPGIDVATYWMEALGKRNLLTSILITAGFIVLIYGGYFLISYNSSKRIIKEK